jgi:tetratricopeptide (TPR) repeat protein
MRARSLGRVVYPLAAVVTLACAGHPMPPGQGEAAMAHPAESGNGVTRGDAVERGFALYEASRYREAEMAFRSALAPAAARARLGLAKVLLATGRAALAEGMAADTVGATPALALDLTVVRGQAFRREGKIAEAEAVLGNAAGDPEARGVRLLLGEVLLEQGRRADAEPVLMTLIEQYNKGEAKSGMALTQVGRAATLLGSPTDANDAFNEAELAGAKDAETLLFRAEVFLDSYDPGHAEEVVSEVLAKAPHHPEALALMAEVKLASNLDFDAAEKLAREALGQNPSLGRAQAVLAGVALRDMNLVDADAHVNAGLASNPRDLGLLSMRAATRFLADDGPGFERVKADVFSKNPRYSRLYQVVGEYAEWEHRYEDIVTMMREALLTDPEDAKVRAQLGFNLIRAGDEAEGVAALARAFKDDPFNVRVFNTLNLYEKEIPKSYESAVSGRFKLRYHRDERPILERYVPALLERAWQKLEKKYGFSPRTPVGIELYPSREHFAIRTSGLPQTFIQGVCFGRTLAAVSPKNERFNLGMTLWHELSHVFHIQLSKNHVPRWFTEGLAEYETLVERPEWRREYDADLYDALEQGRIPGVLDMNRSFSHAEDMQDMATAYYASTQVVGFITERWGTKKVAEMLSLWGEGKRTADVIRGALGVSAEEVDTGFRAVLRTRLARFRGQFAPPSRAGDVASAEARAREAPNDAERQARLALALLGVGNENRARAALDRALGLDPKQGVALWLRVQLAKTSGDRVATKRALDTLLAAGHDGYAVRMVLADVVASPSERRAALEAAHSFDPAQATPLRALVEMARAAQDRDRELSALRALVALEENDGDSYRRLLVLLLAQKAFDEARAVGEAAIYVDIESAEVHRLYAEALVGASRKTEAEAEFESAVRAFGSPAEISLAHAGLATLLAQRGDKKAALVHAKAAAELVKEARTGPI